jgi:hypothetical protein
MNLDNLSGMPDWDDERFNRKREEGEFWKQNPVNAASKKLYEQWKAVMTLLKAAFDTDAPTDETDTVNEDPEKELIEQSKGMILGDAIQVAAKIRSAATGIYMMQMENAVIIRKNAQFIQSGILLLIEEGAISEEHGQIIRTEIDTFRLLFIDWVSTFQKDEFEDEWGLFQ